MKHKLKTSVIGSYPIFPNAYHMMQQYFSQKNVSWGPYISEAVQEMLTAGIDLISDGQTRDPMIQLFTRKLVGTRIRNRIEIIGNIMYPGPITIEDQRYVRRLLPRKKGIIGILTGPYTLAISCVDLFYHDQKNLAFDFAHALQQEAIVLQKYVDLISIDEPCFSTMMPDYAQEVIAAITKTLSCPTRLHVCGDVSRIVPQLVDMPVDILSHEFKASPHLLKVFQEYPSTKKICLGSVRSDDARVEPVDEIINHINTAFDIFGDRMVQIAPDCGQRHLPRNAAFQKLQNLVKAGEHYNG